MVFVESINATLGFLYFLWFFCSVIVCKSVLYVMTWDNFCEVWVMINGFSIINHSRLGHGCMCINAAIGEPSACAVMDNTIGIGHYVLLFSISFVWSWSLQDNDQRALSRTSLCKIALREWRSYDGSSKNRFTCDCGKFLRIISISLGSKKSSLWMLLQCIMRHSHNCK